MKRFLFIGFLVGFLVSCAQKEDILEYVDPFIGTDGIVHTFPGATSPFGMIQLSPDNDTKGWNWCSGYHTSDNSIMGFSHTHLSGTGWSDLGDILVMPTVGDVNFEPGSKENPDEGYRSRISHDADKEKASAGYYSVDLLDYGIKAELTVSARAGFHRYTFPQTEEANIIFDPTHKIFGKVTESNVKVVNATTIEGYSKSQGWGGDRTTYFVAELSKPISGYSANIDCTKLAVNFSTTEGEIVELKVSISMVDQEGAYNNFEADAKPMNFDSALAAVQATWREKLSKYEFDAVDKKQKRILYTGLYHAMIQPNLHQDADGRFWAIGKKHEDEGFVNYSTFSLWDTFRAVHPLFTMTEHKVSADVVRSLVSRYENGGEIPLWELCGHDNTCMISYPAISVISDAILKGIDGIDAEKALEAMISASNFDYMSSSDGESGVEFYNEIGYVPAPIHASVSKTAENSYYDWCIAQVAKKLGKNDIYEEYSERSMRFLNHYDSKSGLLMPKDAEGNFIELDIHDWESLRPHYVSGNIWAYSYFYPHAVDTMINLAGGKEQYIKNLDMVFNTPMDMKGEQHVDISGFFGRYGHGDEPGHNFIYLYSMAGEPQKTAEPINMVVDSVYNDTRNPMPNNDDCGQMSAWYIFSSMGIYPACPGDGKYYIGTPLMNGAKIHTESGKTFTIKVDNLTKENRQVESIFLNDEVLERPYITHEEVMSGATLRFVMGKLR